MVFWFFKRREDSEERFQQLHATLRETFSNVRKDMGTLHKHTEKSHIKHRKHRVKFKNHELRLLKIENQLNLLLNKFLKEAENTQENIIQPQIEQLGEISQEEIFSSLTKTQLDLFKTIYQIQKQANSNKVSLKSIAKIYYPGRNYNSVRSTISDYLTILTTWGLIKKQRVGKESFVALTNNGINLVSSTKTKEKKKKIITKRE